MNRDEVMRSILQALRKVGLATTAKFVGGRPYAVGIYPETNDLRVDLCLDANYGVRFAIESMAPRQGGRIVPKQDDPNLDFDRRLLAARDQIQQKVQSVVPGTDVSENWGDGMGFRVVLDVICPSFIRWDSVTNTGLQTITNVCSETIAALKALI